MMTTAHRGLAISISLPRPFPDVDHQASSVSRALAHARLALDARQRLASVEGPLDDASDA